MAIWMSVVTVFLVTVGVAALLIFKEGAKQDRMARRMRRPENAGRRGDWRGHGQSVR